MADEKHQMPGQMKKPIQKKKAKVKPVKTQKSAFVFVILALAAFLLLSLSAYQLLFSEKIYPGISVAGIEVGGLTQTDAENLLAQKLTLPESLKLLNQNQVFTLYTKDIKVEYNFKETTQKAFSIARSGNLLSDIAKQFNLLLKPEDRGLSVNLDSGKLTKYISVISGQDSVDPIPASIKLIAGRITVSKGSPGKEVDQSGLRGLIEKQLSLASSEDIKIPVIYTDPSISELQALVIKDRAEKYVGKKIFFKFEFNTYNLADTELISILNPKGDFYADIIDADLGKITVQVERDPQNPKFTFDNGRVTQFQPALDGIKVDKEKFKAQLIDSLKGIEQGAKDAIIFDIPVIKTPPEVTTDKINDLGIKELIGRGTSTYYHSIPSRVHNVVLAASRLNGILVKPGETFSFNETLGDVSQFTGYQQAYIISEGKTILGDGGGVCQVSTTLFRALLNAGLPITDRTAHAYRVGYYEQNSPPGLDATVYGPAPDLKFKNDTPGYILIEAIADPKHYSLIFELYGTSDGRVATISKPVVSNYLPALPTVYQDDPTLPAGTVKQVDFSAPGATVTFKYTVTRAGETLINKTFVSNYRPWAAVYLRGTAPAI